MKHVNITKIVAILKCTIRYVVQYIKEIYILKLLKVKANGYNLIQFISYGDTAYVSYPILEESTCTIVLPNFDNHFKMITRSFPAVKAHVYHENLIQGYSSCFVSKERLVLPKHIAVNLDRQCVSDSKFIKSLRNNFFFKKTESIIIDKAIFLCGDGSFNWYHFVMEVVPKCILLKNLPDYLNTHTLLLPIECQDNFNFKSLLDMFVQNAKCRFVSRNETISVHELLVFDEVNILPFNLKNGLWPAYSEFIQNDIFLKKYSEILKCKFIDGKAECCGRKLFLFRDNERRQYNQAEILKVAAKYGFESFSPENLSVYEQARVWSQAQYVIGPSGAAWIGMLFAPSNCIFLSWLPAEYSEFCTYSSLANLLGHQMHFIQCHTESQLKSTSHAYAQSYHIIPNEFERKLVDIYT